MNYLILWITGKLLKIPQSNWRIFSAAILGAFYAIILLIPRLNLLSNLGVKLIFSVVMILIAYGWKSLRLFLRTILSFYLVSFFAGGGILGMIYLTQDSSFLSITNGVLVLANLPYQWLLVGVVLLLCFTFILWPLFQKYNLKGNYLVNIQVFLAGKSVSSRALVDTGNSLREPFSNLPVVIMEEQLFSEILPLELGLSEGGRNLTEIDYILTTLKDSPWEGKIKILPFSSLGTERGLLLGLKPDELLIELEDESIKKTEFIIGIYPGKISGAGDYQTLLHPELVRTELGLRKGVAS